MTRVFLLVCCVAAALAHQDAGNSSNESFDVPLLQKDSSEDNRWLEEEEEEEANDMNELYDSLPPGDDEEIDEDGVELSDNWLVLEDEEMDDEEMPQDEWTSEYDEELDCKSQKTKRHDFYFMHKKYGKKAKKKRGGTKKLPKWKKNCCIRGKRVGNSRRTFLSDDLLGECQERTKNLSTRMSRSCKWIFRSCCEARALRRFYIHHQHNGMSLN